MKNFKKLALLALLLSAAFLAGRDASEAPLMSSTKN